MSAYLGALRAWVGSGDTLIVLSKRPGTAPPPPERTTVEAARPADAGTYERDIGTDTARTFASRLSDTSRCFLVRDGQTIVHATWLSTEPTWVGELGRYFVPPPSAAYVYESYTRPEARGRGIYPRALGAIEGILDQEGIAEMWIGVTKGNHSSLRAITKAGFSPRWEVPYLRRWGRTDVGLPVGAERLLPEGAPDKSRPE
ncbi:MAG: GNAT family N-acetyltransferase [Actinomycetota bacterium]|nr:GNAT family N-acetyltransferase [Actinomycetota bacterium]